MYNAQRMCGEQHHIQILTTYMHIPQTWLSGGTVQLGLHAGCCGCQTLDVLFQACRVCDCGCCLGVLDCQLLL